MTQSVFWKPKFYAGAFVIVSSVALVSFGIIDPNIFRDVILGALAIYSGSTVYENKSLLGTGQSSETKVGGT